MLRLDQSMTPFASTMARGAAFLPPADVTVGDGDLVVSMDVPGLTVDDLAIELTDGHLVVRGERRLPSVAEGTRWTRSERTFGRFERRIVVPDGVDADRVTASIDNGVLSLIIPKPERLEPKTIAIATGGNQSELEPASA